MELTFASSECQQSGEDHWLHRESIESDGRINDAKAGVAACGTAESVAPVRSGGLCVARQDARTRSVSDGDFRGPEACNT